MEESGLSDYNRRLKKAILDVMFLEVETFYIHCNPHPELLIGNRGLVDKEKEEGIILVFGPYSTRHLSWDEHAIHCDMQFNKWEHCSIPFISISRIFDKEGQVIMQWAVYEHSTSAETQSSEADSALTEEEKKSRVIEVDFTKKNKK